jgi:hypothetical protein
MKFLTTKRFWGAVIIILKYAVEFFLKVPLPDEITATGAGVLVSGVVDSMKKEREA